MTRTDHPPLTDADRARLVNVAVRTIETFDRTRAFLPMRLDEQALEAHCHHILGYEALLAQRDARIEQLERKYAEVCALLSTALVAAAGSGAEGPG